MIRRGFLKLLCALPAVSIPVPVNTTKIGLRPGHRTADPVQLTIDDDYLELYFGLFDPPDRWKQK